MPTFERARADRFAAYVDQLAGVLGHRDRHEPLRAYVTGLCLPGERKSVEPMAAWVDPRHVRQRHQSMHHFVAEAPWEETALLRVAREWVLAAMREQGPVAAWIVDDTGFPKKGTHSVGVARQYCGVLGKQDNCQVAVSVSIATETVSVPVAYQLYLPETWATDRRRCRAAGVPDPLTFQPKWQIAHDVIRLKCRILFDFFWPSDEDRPCGRNTRASRANLTIHSFGECVKGLPPSTPPDFTTFRTRVNRWTVHLSEERTRKTAATKAERAEMEQHALHLLGVAATFVAHCLTRGVRHTEWSGPYYDTFRRLHRHLLSTPRIEEGRGHRPRRGIRLEALSIDDHGELQF